MYSDPRCQDHRSTKLRYQTGSQNWYVNSKMNISGRAVVKALMRLFVVVQVEVITQAGEQSRYGGILFDIDVLILDRPPEPFHEDIVKDPATVVHADTNIRRPQLVCKVVGSKLNTLVSVADFRLTMQQGLTKRSHTKGAIQRVGELPGNDLHAHIFNRRRACHLPSERRYFTVDWRLVFRHCNDVETAFLFFALRQFSNSHHTHAQLRDTNFPGCFSPMFPTLDKIEPFENLHPIVEKNLTNGTSELIILIS